MSSSSQRIVGRERLRFASNEELQAYYERKYRDGGYEEGGYVVHGVDVSAMYHARRREAALRLLNPTRTDVVLDAGCGSGALAAELAGRTRQTHAVDIAANALEDKFRSIANLHFQPMNLEAIGFSDARFDAIVCVETLEHLLSPERALAELSRVLKPGGRLVLTYPTINRTVVKRWRLGPRVRVSEHLNEWSYDELGQAVRAAGLTVRDVEGIAFDFGALLGLKHVHRFLASTITRGSLALRRFPRNSMFVAVLAEKSAAAGGVSEPPHSARR